MSEPFEDAELRAAYAPKLRQPMGARGPDCPTPDALLAALNGEGPEPERLQLLDHALRCGWCRRELALLRAVSSAGAEDGARTHAPRAGWQRFIPLAAAASIVLAVGIVSISQWRQRSREEIMRAPGADGPALLAPEPNSAHAPGPVRFVWRPVPGALRYTLEVDATDGAVLFLAVTGDTTLSAQLAAVPSGEARWFVRAQMDDGSERRSQTRGLRLQ